ncbi:MAG: N-6 DNA methylase [Candidatus Delongbacteria bacterium]|nr:N-6 DNA methylase [Candidatus Delongbacteria bacterium]MBN2836735.1 N-6 DNA methylase [Candidatus Delongbacteria bacterium]
MKYYDIKDSAEYLGVSKATVDNWIKRGIISKDAENGFSEEVLSNFKIGISSGEMKLLQGRANRIANFTKVIPQEYLTDKNSISKIIKILNYIDENNLNIKSVLPVFAISLLANKKYIDVEFINGKISLKVLKKFNSNIADELNLWMKEENVSKISEHMEFLISLELPNENDTLGLIYQACEALNSKSIRGAFFTPVEMVDYVLGDLAEGTFLDPCCGTGQFLLERASFDRSPDLVYGIDVDNSSVRISRINLMLMFPEKDFVPNIFKADFLTENISQITKIDSFDNIATNPPWGIKFTKVEKEEIGKLIGKQYTSDSFAMFLKKSYDLLSDNGLLNFLLPESFTNIATHKEVRRFIIENTKIQKIHLHGKYFTGVLSPLVTLLSKKQKVNNQKFWMITETESFMAEYKDNSQFRLTNSMNIVYSEILEIMEKKGVKLLSLKDLWFLGIVTGNNNDLVKENYDGECGLIIGGKNVSDNKIDYGNKYLVLDKGRFQQNVDLDFFKIKPKLVYSFISSDLKFAVDNMGVFTLNSLNCIVLKKYKDLTNEFSEYLNSKTANFFWKINFNTIKVLKSDLMEIPFPSINFLKSSEFRNVIESKITEDIDKIIYKYFGFSKYQINIIEKCCGA